MFKALKLYILMFFSWILFYDPLLKKATVKVNGTDKLFQKPVKIYYYFLLKNQMIYIGYF